MSATGVHRLPRHRAASYMVWLWQGAHVAESRKCRRRARPRRRALEPVMAAGKNHADFLDARTCWPRISPYGAP